MSNEPIKIPINYAEASETIRKVLGLKGSPVAIKFATSKEEIPAGMEELDKTIRHCSMVNLARNEGKIFYATSGKHECNGGAWALGLREITPTQKSGDFYFKLRKYESAAACKHTIDKAPPSRFWGNLRDAVYSSRKNAVRTACRHDCDNSTEHAQTCPEFSLPVRWKDSC